MELRVAYAACRGNHHSGQELPCQDVVAGCKWENFGAVVLADGAGSCLYAAEGAKTSADEVLRLLQQHGEEWLADELSSIAEEIIASCRTALVENGYPLDEQASTLLFALADEGGRFLCGHLGDGCVFRSSDSSAELISAPENGDHPNETIFVTSEGAEEHLRLLQGALRPNEAVVLCSDGAAAALYQWQERSCAPAVHRMSSWLGLADEAEVAQAIEMNLDTIFREKTDDDMSVAVLSYRGADDGSEREGESYVGPFDD